MWRRKEEGSWSIIRLECSHTEDWDISFNFVWFISQWQWQYEVETWNTDSRAAWRIADHSLIWSLLQKHSSLWAWILLPFLCCKGSRRQLICTMLERNSISNKKNAKQLFVLHPSFQLIVYKKCSHSRKKNMHHDHVPTQGAVINESNSALLLCGQHLWKWSGALT